MKAISLWAPWPIAIFWPEPTKAGDPAPKRIENRTSWREGSPALGLARKLVGDRIWLHSALGHGNRSDFESACDFIVGILGPTVIPKLIERPRFAGTRPIAWPPAKSLPRGALVGSAKLVEVVWTLNNGHRTADRQLRNGGACSLCGQDYSAYTCPKADPWAFERSIGLVLAEVEPLEKPIELKGRQGWFNVPDEVLRKLPRLQT